MYGLLHAPESLQFFELMLKVTFAYGWGSIVVVVPPNVGSEDAGGGSGIFTVRSNGKVIVVLVMRPLTPVGGQSALFESPPLTDNEALITRFVTAFSPRPKVAVPDSVT